MLDNIGLIYLVNIPPRKSTNIVSWILGFHYLNTDAQHYTLSTIYCDSSLENFANLPMISSALCNFSSVSGQTSGQCVNPKYNITH